MYARFIRFMCLPDRVYKLKPVAALGPHTHRRIKVEKTKEAIWNDLELYFYLYKEQQKWELTVESTYFHRARTKPGLFIRILEEFCNDNHYIILNKEYFEHKMVFNIKTEVLD